MSTGGGGYVSVGGISADINLSTGNLDQNLAKVKAGLDAVRAEIARLLRETQAGTISVGEFDAQFAHLKATEQGLVSVQQQLTQAMAATVTATVQVNTSMAAVATHAEKAALGGKNLGMTLMQLGYIVDDVQYGMMGVVNNIAPLVIGMTGNAGIAAAAQIVTVGVYQLTKHWDELMNAMGVGIPAPAKSGLEALNAELKEVSKTLDELGKKTRLSLPEMMDLEQNRTRAAALKAEIKEQEEAAKVGAGPTKAEAERGQAFTAAVREQGRGSVVDALEAEMRRRAEDEGVTLDRATLDERRQRAGQARLTDAEFKAQQGQKYLVDNETNTYRTPEEMARLTLLRGARGEKGVGEEVADLMDRAFGTAKDSGLSAFSKSFGAASPEGKAEFDRMADARKVNDRAKRDQERQDEELSDLTEQEFQAELRLRRDTKAKNKRNRQENLRAGQEAAPGIDEFAERRVTMAMAGGIPMDAVVAEIRDVLMASGRTEKQAGAAAEDIVKAAGKDVEKQAAHDAMNPQREQERKKLSEVFDASDLAGKIQSSIGGEDIQKQQLSELKQAKLALARMAEEKFTVRLKK